MKKKYIYILSFLLPICLLTLIYYCNRIFTDYSILINDLDSQYVSFLSYLRNSVPENGIFYSFSKGLGGNFFGIFTYYLISPFNLLVFLFSKENIETAIALIIILRSGFMGISFAYFLQKRQEKAGLITVAFAVMYALCSYIVILGYHILWADAYILLPLVINAQINILQGGKCKSFIAWFTILIFCNYYMAYMVGVFCLLLYLCSVICVNDKKISLQSFKKMALSALASIGIGAVLLIPTCFSLLQGKTQANSDQILAMNQIVFNPLAIIPKIFIGAYDSVGNISAPFVYCGAGAIALVIAYFFLANKTKRQKLAALFMLLFFALSLVWTPLYKGWHMFNPTNAFPYRFTYIVIFFVLWLCYTAAQNFNSINLKKYIPTAFLIASMVAAAGVWYPIHIKNRYIMATFLLALATVFCLIIYSKKGKKRYAAAMLILCIIDVTVNGIMVTRQNYAALGTVKKDSYKSNVIATQNIPRPMEGQFYRIEEIGDENRTPSWPRNNQAFGLGFYGVTYTFTSLPETIEEQARYFLLTQTEYKNLSRAFLGIKYTMQTDKIVQEHNAFPLIFAGSGQEYNEQKADIVQSFINTAFNKNYTPHQLKETDTIKQICKMANDNSAYLTTLKGGKIKGNITAQKPNTTAYTSIIYDTAWHIWVNGKKTDIQKALDNFIAFSLEEGQNNITMVYIPKGFIFGVIITLITSLSLICAALKTKKAFQNV